MLDRDETAEKDAGDDIHALFHGAPKTTEFRKLRKRIIRDTREAIDRYGMVERRAPDAPREKWLVCLSGGKDSYTLLAALTELQWRGLLPVDILACNLDQGQPGFPATVLPEFLGRMGVPHRIEYADTYSIVVDKVPQGRTYCALCSRLRRGNLYRIAREEGCSAVVLGHHRDDILETFFLNLFHGGRLATMPPKLLNDEGDLFVLRPLAHVAEADCARFAQAMNYPIIPCDLCGSQDGLQRQVIKADARRLGGAGARAAAEAVLGADERAPVASARSRAVRFQCSHAQRLNSNERSTSD
jgi:tRNA 2-thiocytidine biosynthesis protein TtcA